jgi:hypothetical protein
VVSIAATWISVLLSLAWLRASGRLSMALAVAILGVACVGTVAVLRFRRAPRAGAVARESCSS